MRKKEFKKYFDKELILELYNLAYRQYKIKEYQEALKTFNEIISELELVKDKSIFINKFLVSSKTAKALMEAKLGNWETSKENLLKIMNDHPYHIKAQNYYNRIIKGNFFDKDSFNLYGFDIIHKHRTTHTDFDAEGYRSNGFNVKGIHKNTNTEFDEDGYNMDGFNKSGFNIYGRNMSGFDREGFNVFGFNKDGFDRQGFNSNGYNKLGYDRKGFNKRKFNYKGINKYTQSEYDREGYNIHGYDREGFNKKGFNKEKIHKYTKTKYDAFGKTFDNKERVRKKSILEKEYEEYSRDL